VNTKDTLRVNFFLKEAHEGKVNIDNIRTSIFKEAGEMHTLTIDDYEGFSKYDYIQHGTPIAIMAGVALRSSLSSPQHTVRLSWPLTTLCILHDTHRRFDFCKLETAVSSASSTPTLAPSPPTKLAQTSHG
jgi:hypothetical protein